MATAVQHLREPDPEMQVLGAAYIQHECYNDSDAKVEVRSRLVVRRVKVLLELLQIVQPQSLGPSFDLGHSGQIKKYWSFK